VQKAVDCYNAGATVLALSTSVEADGKGSKAPLQGSNGGFGAASRRRWADMVLNRFRRPSIFV